MAVTETLREKMPDEMRAYRKGVFMNPLNDFMKSEDKTLIYKCVDEREKLNCLTSLRQYIKKHDLNLVIWTKKNNVYVIKP